MRIWCGLMIYGVLVGCTPWTMHSDTHSLMTFVLHQLKFDWSQSMCLINSLIASTQITMTSKPACLHVVGTKNVKNHCFNKYDIHGKLLMMHLWMLSWACRSCRLNFKVSAISCVHVWCQICGHECLSHCSFLIENAFITHEHHELIFLLRSMEFFNKQKITNIIVPPKI